MAGPATVVIVNGNNHLIEANKRLAILGDAVASQILCKIWFESKDQFGTFTCTHPITPPNHADDFEGAFQSPAAWNNIRQGTLQNAALATMGNALGLGSTIIASPGHFGRPGTVMMATTMEALLGAVYLDGGNEAVTRVMIHVELTQPPVMSTTLNCP